jgi:hypothetical protein
VAPFQRLAIADERQADESAAEEGGSGVQGIWSREPNRRWGTHVRLPDRGGRDGKRAGRLALWLGDRIVGIVEAKKLTIGPQNVLT